MKGNAKDFVFSHEGYKVGLKDVCTRCGRTMTTICEYEFANRGYDDCLLKSQQTFSSNYVRSKVSDDNIILWEIVYSTRWWMRRSRAKCEEITIKRRHSWTLKGPKEGKKLYSKRWWRWNNFSNVQNWVGLCLVWGTLNEISSPSNSYWLNSERSSQ